MNIATDSVMTVKEVADYLRVNQRTVYRLAVDKKLPGFKVGTTWRFKCSDIERWIDIQATAGPNKTNMAAILHQHGIQNVRSL